MGAANRLAAAEHGLDIAIMERALNSAQPTDKWIPFGDVGLTRKQLQTFRDRLAGKLTPAPQGSVNPDAVTPAGTTFKWTGGNISYRFDPTEVGNGTITALKMQQFRDAIAEWAAFANLHFTEFTGSTPANFVTVQENASLAGGFSSSVGMHGGEQFLQFAPAAWNRGTICHEVGHALGLWHEQQRPDRDNYVIINFANMDPASQANFVIISDGQTLGTPYDFYSVMHYSRTAFSNNGQDTISMQPAYAAFINIIGAVFDRTLSKIERASMATIYGNPSPLPGSNVTNTKDSGPGSLRTAIYYAFDKSTNQPPVPTTISFHIPFSDPNFNGGTGVFTIKPTYLMTAPGDGTSIDGATQTSFTGNTNNSGPEIVLDGSSQAQYETVGTFGPALILRQANCLVRGFVIRGYDQQGIQITGSAATNNVISACFIGTNETGTVGIGNGNTFPGVEILNGANNNRIGAADFFGPNIISGSSGYGVSIHGSGSDNNVVQGNWIGLNGNGSSALSNAYAGVVIYGGAKSNVVGGTGSSAHNFICGNKLQGIQISDAGTDGNIVLGNSLGLNVPGSSTVGNGFSDPATHQYAAGIDIFGGAQNNVIGGTTSATVNYIVGNAGGGISISQAGTNGNTVEGNFIGVNPAGSGAIANGAPEAGYHFSGVSIFGGAQGNTVGGTASGARNLISGNGADGVTISGTNTNNNQVEGNFIGTDVNGSVPVPNQFAGVSIFGGAQSNTIGGLTAAARNIISGNTSQGVVMSGTGTSQNSVLGNYIGTETAGANSVPNSADGVGIFSGAQNNTVGGLTPAARNLLSGNSLRDIEISGANTNSNVVQGNFIGTNASGTDAISNSNNDGVGIFGGAQNNVIGGTAAGARNLICGHSGHGIAIANAGTSGNLVQGNTIGSGNANLRNIGANVAIFDSAQGNIIGGSATGASNIIAASGNEGIAIYSLNATTIRNTFSRNSIFGNGGKGIALYNGGNNSQPFPTLSSVTVSSVTNPNGTDVTGSLTAAANTSFTLEFFANTGPEPSGFGEGQYFIGSVNVTTNAAGSVNFTAPLAAAVPGFYISAAATDPLGNTSEFSGDQVAIPTADSDSDGMPNNYENAHGLNPSVADGSLDSDGDGLTNLQEFKAGTDPKSGASAFRISAFDRSTGSPRISFPAVAGKTYKLEFRDDLSAGNWMTLTDEIFSSSSVTLQIADPSAAGVTTRFYRISLEP